jgi:hypothetical protein
VDGLKCRTQWHARMRRVSILTLKRVRCKCFCRGAGFLSRLQSNRLSILGESLRGVSLSLALDGFGFNESVDGESRGCYAGSAAETGSRNSCSSSSSGHEKVFWARRDPAVRKPCVVCLWPKSLHALSSARSAGLRARKILSSDNHRRTVVNPSTEEMPLRGASPRHKESGLAFPTALNSEPDSPVMALRSLRPISNQVFVGP